MGTRSTRLLLCALTAAAMALLAAPVVRADSVQEVFQEYQSTGQINACKHSAGSLGVGVGNDLEQYATDFVDALRAAQLARGRCGGSSASSSSGGSSNDSDTSTVGPAGSSKDPPTPKQGGAGTTIPSFGEGRSAVAPALPISLERGAGGGTPGPIVILAILAGLLLLGGVPALIGRYFGFGLRWLAPVRHVFGEGALRMSSAGAGLADWLRMDALRRA